MVREIKFRAWNTGCSEMMSWEDIDKEDKTGIVQFLDIIKEDGFEVMQYTGLQDRNGKEIYEGDILDVTSELLTNFGRTRTGKMHTAYYEVRWVGEGWGKKTLKAANLVVGNVTGGLAITAEYGVVIGNIHENKELIP